MIRPVEPLKGLSFPHVKEIEGRSITLKLMDGSEHDALTQFSAKLNDHDRLFMRMDLTNPESINEWMKNLTCERTRSVLVLENGEVIGYASLHQNKLLWTRHLGEIRLFILPEYRQLGLGRLLAEVILGLARDNDVQTVEVHIPRIQPDLQRILQQMGFMPEALLANWLIDPDGHTHDLVIMAYRFNEKVRAGD